LTAASDSSIIVYTVRLMEGNEDLLRSCASSEDNYYDVEDTSDLVPAFQAIGKKISQLRLSQ
jgi:hypothetical protein